MRRPFGLTLAVAAVAVWYGVLPLLELYFLRRVGATAEEAFVPGGIEITTWDWIEALIGGGMLLLCLLAWWGRPAWIRFVLQGVILLLTAIFVYRAIQAATVTTNPIYGGQVQDALRRLLLCQLPATLLIPLYVLWYFNRAPARAFYRRVPLAALAREDPPAASDLEADPPQ